MRPPAYQPYPFRQRALCAAIAACFALPTARANPTGPQVVHGEATIAAQGGQLTITNAPNTVINWQGFSIGANEVTRFVQQSAASAVLNRVVTLEQSQILGSLLSNGRVFLINPNGILIGRDAQIDVAGLIASTLNIRDQDFLGNRLSFEAGAIAGSVHNQGSITTTSGGVVYLMGSSVQNSGIIRAPDGSVVLAAGSHVRLGDSAAPGVGVEFAARDQQAVNLGQILTQGGGTSIFAGLIEQQGVVRADSVSRDASGRIVFRATRDATLAAESVTSASGAAAGTVDVQAGGTALIAGGIAAASASGAGGRVVLSGERVALAGTGRVDVWGAQGGGTALIGGGTRGQDASVANAQAAYLAPGSVVRADALASGTGGSIVIWSERGSRVDGLLSARGGTSGGGGGLIETSSAGQLAFRGEVDLRAPAGREGTWLLDPLVLTLRGGAAPASEDGRLDADVPIGDVLGRIQAGDNGTLNYTLSEGKLETTDANIVLSARRSILAEGTFDHASGNPRDALGRLVLRPGRSLTLETINAPGDGNGGIDLTGSAHGVDLTVAVSGAGGIDLRAGLTGTQQATLIAGGLSAERGDIRLQARTGIRLEGKVGAEGSTIQLQSDSLTFGPGGSIANPVGVVSILPLSTNQPVVLGDTVPGLLSITETMLNRIDVGASGVTQIASGGPIQVRSSVTSAGLGSLTLAANGGVDIGAALEHAGTLKLIADRVSIPAPGSVGAGTLVIEPLDRASTSIVLGGSGGANVLALSAAELARIDATALQFNAGPELRLAADVTFDAGQVGRVLAFSNGTIFDGTAGLGGFVLKAAALTLEASGGVDFTTDVGALSARNLSDGSLFLRDVGSGTLNVQVLESRGGPLDLASAKNLRVESGAFSAGASSLAAGGGLTIAAGTVEASGSITLRGKGSATPGFGAGVRVEAPATVGGSSFAGPIALISDAGPVALAGNVLTTGGIAMTSAGGLAQSGGGVRAHTLALTGSGAFDLRSAGNDVDVVAADIADGSLALRTLDPLAVGTIGDLAGVSVRNPSGSPAGGNLDFDNTTVLLNDSTIAASGNVRVTGGSLVLESGVNTIDAAALITDVLSLGQVSSGVSLAGNAPITVNRQFDWAGGTLAIGTTVSVASAAALIVRNLVTLDGTLDTASAAASIDASLGGAGRLMNSGVLTAASVLGTELDNRGSFIVNGLLTLGRAGAAHLNTGSLAVANGDLLVLQSGGSFEQRAGTLSIAASRSLRLAGPAFLWTGGTLNGASPASILDLGRADLISSGSAARSLERVRVLARDLDLQAGELSLLSDASLALSRDARIAAGARLALAGGTMQVGRNLELDGTLSAAASALTVPAGSVNNRGVVELSGGLLELTGGGTGGGRYQLASGAQIKFANGSYTMGGIAGQGSVLAAGANTIVTVSGGVSAASGAITSGATLSLGQAASFGSLTIDGGTLAGAGDVTVASLNLLDGACAGSGALTASDVNWSGGVIGSGYRSLSLAKASGDLVTQAPLQAGQDVSLTAQNGDLVVAHDIAGGANVSLGGRNVRIEPEGDSAAVSAPGELRISTPGALRIDNRSGGGSLSGGAIQIDAGSVTVLGPAGGLAGDGFYAPGETAGNALYFDGPVPAASISGGQVRVNATAGSAVLDGALIAATGDLALTAAGPLQVLGDSAPAKLLAGGTLSVGAQSVLLRGGDFGAGIDPTDLTMTLPGDLVLQAGNAPALIAGDTVTIAAANVSLTGGAGGYAAIQALAGDLTLATPGSGSVVLTPGSGVDADAVVVAPLSGAARILTGQCIGCNSLAADPFGNLITETGVFGGTVDVTGVVPASFLPPDNAVIQATVVAFTSTTSQTLLGAPNDDNNSRKRAVPACPVR